MSRAGEKGSNRSDRPHWLPLWRHGRRLSQAELAELLGYDVTYIAKIEGGTRPPSRQFLARLAQIDGAPEEALRQALSTDLARPALPSSADELVGRHQEVADLLALLRGSSRLVTLTGPPGIGKTRLALEAATRLDSVVTNGSWWVSLIDVTDPDEVIHRINRALGVTTPAGADPVDRLVDRLRGHRALVVLDNFEQVIDARAVVSRLVGSGDLAGVTLLVTSREALGLASEHVYRVPPLELPDLSSDPSLDEISKASAVELFVGRARMAEPRFRLTESNCRAVAQACTGLDGIPLSIVLAAGAIHVDGADRVAERAGRTLDVSAGAPLDLSPHQRTVRDAIGGSWNGLLPAEAHLFARLAVFAGGCDAEAACAVAGPAAGGDRATVMGALEALRRKSLIEVRPDDHDVPRFEMLASIRSYALERLEESGDLAATRALHLHYFDELARRCGTGLIGQGQSECVRLFALERDNLAAAFRWAMTSDPDAALRLAANCWRFYLMRDIGTGRQWLQQAIEATVAAARTPARAAALAGAGALAWVTGNFEQSDAFLDEAMELATAMELPDVAAIVWLNRGALAEQRSQFTEADAHFVEALRLYTSIDDDRGRAQALVGRGMICRRRDDLTTACTHWLAAARLFRSVGDRFNQTMALSNLARAAEQEGQIEEAEEWLREARAIQIKLGDGRGLATTTAALARLAFKRDAVDTAEALFMEALIAYHHLGDRPWSAATLVSLARVLVSQGRRRAGVRLVGAADALWSDMGSEPRGEDRAVRDEVLSACAGRLSQGEVSRALGAGSTMTLADAIEFARSANEGGGSWAPTALVESG